MYSDSRILEREIGFIIENNFVKYTYYRQLCQCDVHDEKLSMYICVHKSKFPFMELRFLFPSPAPRETKGSRIWFTARTTTSRWAWILLDLSFPHRASFKLCIYLYIYDGKGRRKLGPKTFPMTFARSRHDRRPVRQEPPARFPFLSISLKYRDLEDQKKREIRR